VPALGRLDAGIVSLCQEALDALGEAEVGLRAELLASIAAHRALAGNGPEVGELSREAVRLASSSGDAAAQWAALLARYISLYGTPDAQGQLQVADELMALPLEQGQRRAGWITFSVGPSPCSIPKLALGDRTGFDDDVDEVARLVSAHARPSSVVMLTQWRALQAFLDGDFEAAAARMDELVRLAEGVGNWDLAYAAQLFWLAYERGEVDAIRPLLVATVEDNPGTPAYAAALALIDGQRGDLDSAASLVERLVEPWSVVADYTIGASIYCLSEACALTGRTAEAAVLLERAAPFSGLLSVVGPGTLCMGAADRSIGQLHLVLGQLDESVAALRRALDLETTFKSPALAVRSRVWLARALGVRGGEGDDAERRALADEAGRIAARLGMKGLLAEVDRLRP
jgi:tetratricopeptide (TPR) repeat protein